jgi:hypothetical protein
MDNKTLEQDSTEYLKLWLLLVDRWLRAWTGTNIHQIAECSALTDNNEVKP